MILLKMNKATLIKLKQEMKENVFHDCLSNYEENNPLMVRFEEKPHYFYFDFIHKRDFEINYTQFQELYKEFSKHSNQNPYIEMGF